MKYLLNILISLRLRSETAFTLSSFDFNQLVLPKPIYICKYLFVRFSLISVNIAGMDYGIY